MNRVELVGRLVKDPAKGEGVAMFTLAVDRQNEGADYPQVKVFGKQADPIVKYLRKGSQVSVEGKLETGSYDKGGQTVYYTDVVASRVEFIGSGTKHAETKQKEPYKPQEESQEGYTDFEIVSGDVPF